MTSRRVCWPPAPEVTSACRGSEIERESIYEQLYWIACLYAGNMKIKKVQKSVQKSMQSCIHARAKASVERGLVDDYWVSCTIKHKEISDLLDILHVLSVKVEGGY